MSLQALRDYVSVQSVIAADSSDYVQWETNVEVSSQYLLEDNLWFSQVR